MSAAPSRSAETRKNGTQKGAKGAGFRRGKHFSVVQLCIFSGTAFDFCIFSGTAFLAF
jgi:hypothetical protein